MSRKATPSAETASAAADRPSKLYYSIGEVAELTGIKQHVLRYWETEFPTLRPRKTRTGSRRYRPQDIEEIHAIKRLLYEQGFRIEGARKVRHLAHRQDEAAAAAASAAAPAQLEIGFQRLDPQAQLRYVRDELRAVAQILREMGEGAAASSAAAPAPGASAKATPRGHAKAPAARLQARAAKEG